MSILLQSFSLVAIAEIGDKTQLLSMMLAARYRRFWPIIAGILVATLVNHAFTALLGASVGGWFNPAWLNLIVSLLFIVIGVWALIPDSAPVEKQVSVRGAFAASVMAFFIAEMGDKTQLATFSLSAEAANALWQVVLGTTLGMLAANIPAVLCGEVIIRKWPLKTIRLIACIMFVAYGLYGLMTQDWSILN